MLLNLFCRKPPKRHREKYSYYLHVKSFELLTMWFHEFSIPYYTKSQTFLKFRVRETASFNLPLHNEKFRREKEVKVHKCKWGNLKLE